MPGRFRSREGRYKVGGKATYSDLPNSPTHGASGPMLYESISDTTMPRPYTVDHSLVITRKEVSPLLISGRTTWHREAFGAPGHILFDGWNPANRTLHNYAPVISTINWPYWRTKALANMNPYKPNVDLPLFLFELRELPKMLQQLGRVLGGQAKPSDVPGGFLGYQFGWAPLVSDTLALFKLTVLIDARIRYLRNLEGGTHISRKLFDGVIMDTVSPGYQAFITNMPGNPYCYTASVRTVERLKVWFTANGKLMSVLPPSSLDLRILSTRIVLGLTATPYRLWDALPWSWLIDYLYNIGDFLEARDGLTRLQVTRLNVMATVVKTITHQGVQTAPGLTASEPVLTWTSKQRSPFGHPTPNNTMTPFFTGKMIAILGALATSKALKRFGR